jgi:hypothetical protein
MTSSIDPATLTPALRQALCTVHDHSPSRSSGGYGRQPNFVSRKTALKLMEKGLVRRDIGARGERLLITGAGFNTWAVLVERQKRTAA